MSDETEEQKKLMRQIDISCVQAFHTMDELMRWWSWQRNIVWLLCLPCRRSAPMWQNGCRTPEKSMREAW